MTQDPRKQRTQDINNILVNGSPEEKAALADQARRDIDTFILWGIVVPLFAVLAGWLLWRLVASLKRDGARLP